MTVVRKFKEESGKMDPKRRAKNKEKKLKRLKPQKRKKYNNYKHLIEEE